MTMCRISLVKGLGPALQIAEGWSVDLPAEGAQGARRADQSVLADDLVCAERDGAGRVPRRLHRDEQLERQSRHDQLRPHRRRPDFAGRRCCASRWRCTTWPGRRSSGRVRGTCSARWNRRRPIIAPARTSARSTADPEPHRARRASKPRPVGGASPTARPLRSGRSSQSP